MQHPCFWIRAEPIKEYVFVSYMSPRIALPFRGTRASKLIGKGVKALIEELPLNIDPAGL
jgi:hypothetical protein